MDGTAAVGTGTTWARADHVHPSDTSRYAASNPSGYQTAAQVTASLASYLPLAGGAMTGEINSVGVNFGSTFASSASDCSHHIALYGAPGSAWGGFNTTNGALNVVANAVGMASFSGTSGFQMEGYPIAIDGAAATNRNLFGKTAGVNRWGLFLGNNTAEGGSNAGSDFGIVAYTDAGVSLGAPPLFIQRSTGFSFMNGYGATMPALAGGVGSAGIGINKAAAANLAFINAYNNGVLRWSMQIANSNAEGGSNAGSDFSIAASNDAGANLSTPLSIARSTGAATLISARCTAGYYCQPGPNVAPRGNRFNIDYTGTVAQLWIDATNMGTFSFTSDYRVKKDVADLPSMWDRAKALRPISYTHQDFTPPVELQRDADAKPLVVGDDVERWGFVAHELQETLIQDAATGEKDKPDAYPEP